ncbi:hypothetical protein AWZ03_015036 [Drosophila navojoa]|uniref:Retrotransposon gag domain-containing protein n=1 Tax=Drosophila navojoa TaxID=7232 RepID=A0A484AR23_DRONA|nr:hypothetical protein AWZ03_015036 [Drosophila navojoa]
MVNSAVVRRREERKEFSNTGEDEALSTRGPPYSIGLDQMPRPMSEVLADKAAKWFLTSGLRDSSWADFGREIFDFFLPPQYFERLEVQIRSRHQREGENFKDYLIELKLLMWQAQCSTA